MYEKQIMGLTGAESFKITSPLELNGFSQNKNSSAVAALKLCRMMVIKLKLAY